MAKPKKQTKKAKKPTKKTGKKPKQAAKKPAKRAPKALAAKPTGAAIERQVTALLASNDAGEIDNVFDIIDELVDYDKRLPKTSPLRKQWDAFFTECEQIMIEVSQDRA